MDKTVSTVGNEDTGNEALKGLSDCLSGVRNCGHEIISRLLIKNI